MTHKVYTKEDYQYVLDSFEISNGNPAEAQRLLKGKINPLPDVDTIRKYWRNAELCYNPQHGGKRVGRNGDRRYLSQEEKELIIRRFPIYGSQTKVAKALGHTTKTVKDVLKEEGLIKKSEDLETRLNK